MPLDGYISTAATSFECDCGNSLPVPSYSNCKCGRVWNSYVIGTGGDETKEASITKIVCREIPVRPNVIVAKKRDSNKREEKLKRVQKRLGARSRSHYNTSKEVVKESSGGRVSQLDKLYREAVNTRNMDPNSHAYGRGEEDPLFGEYGHEGYDYSGVSRREFDRRMRDWEDPETGEHGYDPAKASQRARERQDDLSGYNWGPAPDYDPRSEPGPDPNFVDGRPLSFDTPTYNPRSERYFNE